MAVVTASETAQAINDIIKFDSAKDQEGLLEVISNYFCPDDDPRSDSENSDSESDTEMEGNKYIPINNFKNQ